MSVLQPATLAVLKGVRPLQPLFSNVVTAELFEAAHTRGSLTVLPQTTGGFVVFDQDAPLGQGILEGPIASLEKAHGALERHAAARAPRPHAAEPPRAA